MNDERWEGFGTALMLVLLIIVGVSIFNIHRARILPFDKESKMCVVRDGSIEACYPQQKVE